MKKVKIKNLMYLTLALLTLAIPLAVTNRVEAADLFEVIGKANAGQELSDKEYQQLQGDIKSGKVTYDAGTKKWTYNGSTTGGTQSTPTQAQVDDRLERAKKYVDSFKTEEEKNKEQKQVAEVSTPAAQRSTYTRDEIEAAAKRSNEGKAQPGDAEIVAYGIQVGTIMTKEDGQYGVSSQAHPETWGVYAELLMAQEESNQESQPYNILGEGDVWVELSWETISEEGNRIAKNNGTEAKAGTRLSSILSTYNHYNYIETFSGDTVTAHTGNSISGVMRVLGGGLAFISAIFSQITQKLVEWTGKFLVEFNLYHIFWDNTSKIVSENPLTTALATNLSKIGIDQSLFKIIFSFSFIFITILFGFRLIRNISRGFTPAGILDPSKKWFYSLLPVYVILPIFSLMSGYLVQEMVATNITTAGVGNRYLINARYWADASNLSPSGGYTADTPYAGPNKGFVDTSYAPYTQKGTEIIKNINQSGYSWKFNSEPTEEQISFELIHGWMANQTFSVNTYAGDVKASNASDPDSFRAAAATLGDDTELKKVGDGKTAYDSSAEKANIKKLDEYIWSVKQSPDDTQKNPISYDPKLITGAENGNAFTNQSVALLLQSSFSDSGAKFYAYNISPTGAQATMTNLSTVKTQWKQVSLVGTGGMGQFSSYVGLVGGYLSIFIINLAVVVGLISVGAWEGASNFLKSLFKATYRGSIVETVATFLYYIATFSIGVVSFSLSVVAYNTVSFIASSFSASFLQESMPFMLDSTALIEGVLAIALSLFLAWPKGFDFKTNRDFSSSRITALLSAILAWAKSTHDRLKIMLPEGPEVLFAGGPSGYYNDNIGYVYNPNVKQQKGNRDNKRNEDNQPDVNEQNDKKSTPPRGRSGDEDEFPEGPENGGRRTGELPNNPAAERRRRLRESISGRKPGNDTLPSKPSVNKPINASGKSELPNHPKSSIRTTNNRPAPPKQTNSTPSRGNSSNVPQNDNTSRAPSRGGSYADVVRRRKNIK